MREASFPTNPSTSGLVWALKLKAYVQVYVQISIVNVILDKHK
jgi:hypothetical protein